MTLPSLDRRVATPFAAIGFGGWVSTALPLQKKIQLSSKISILLI